MEGREGFSGPICQRQSLGKSSPSAGPLAESVRAARELKGKADPGQT